MYMTMRTWICDPKVKAQCCSKIKAGQIGGWKERMVKLKPNCKRCRRKARLYVYTRSKKLKLLLILALSY